MIDADRADFLQLLERFDFDIFKAPVHGYHFLPVTAAANGKIEICRYYLLDHHLTYALTSIPADKRFYFETVPSLFFAIFIGSFPLVQLFVDYGADLHFLTADRSLGAMYYACQFGHLSIVKLLIAKGVSISESVVSYRSGKFYYSSPLSCATVQNHNDIVSLLLKHDADPYESVGGSMCYQKGCIAA